MTVVAMVDSPGPSERFRQPRAGCASTGQDGGEFSKATGALSVVTLDFGTARLRD
jgi:hypothetical protein